MIKTHGIFAAGPALCLLKKKIAVSVDENKHSSTINLSLRNINNENVSKSFGFLQFPYSR